ncbi:MAG: TIGR04282 family arsenosugar biosynthesis glycosyltransferase [Burkholderiaceae bacterium]|nr:TIGR04282 family arsenosugar biosynthesis glycosyltransferase [Burkholderiaceae bacterium]
MTLCRTVIIAKAPVAGYCKTRLIPALGPDGAAQLAAQMLKHTVRTAIAAQLGPVELCAAPHAAHPLWATLELPASLGWSDQGEGDLGQRMARAAQRTLARGEHLLLIGSDCPVLTAKHLRDAAGALQPGTAALIPTFDGGYALLGLASMQPHLFTDMPWSTADVARITLDRLAQVGVQVHLSAKVHDVDTPADLDHLPHSLRVQCATLHAAAIAPKT